MLKYVTTAAALRVFSAGPVMRGLYRKLGNGVGNRRRQNGVMPSYYLERVRRMVRLLGQHRFVKDGDRIFELGTGWLHWEALTLRLLFDIEAVLYDVWDNRQLGGLKNYVGQLGPLLTQVEGLTPAQISRAQRLIGEITKVESFEELYSRLGFEYVVEESGSLSRFRDGSVQLVVSGGVLEHVRSEALPTLIAETRRILNPGGFAIHSIDTSDHLSHYDGAESKKRYLSVSEASWRHLYDNEVQHINRIQRAEWLGLFRAGGFELIDEDGARVDISQLRLAERYSHMDRSDLERTVLRFAFKLA
jgi:SAM-dependent methyltransferase